MKREAARLLSSIIRRGALLSHATDDYAMFIALYTKYTSARTRQKIIIAAVGGGIYSNIK